MGARKRTGLAAVVAAGALAGMLTVLTVSSGASPAVPLVQAATCAAPTPLPAVDGSRSDGDTLVSFQVPATTRLRVESGAVVAAATNTGCTPRAGDRFVVADRVATAAEAEAALATSWSGDWTTPGAWHPAG